MSATKVMCPRAYLSSDITREDTRRAPCSNKSVSVSIIGHASSTRTENMADNSNVACRSILSEMFMARLSAALLREEPSPYSSTERPTSIEMGNTEDRSIRTESCTNDLPSTGCGVTYAFEGVVKIVVRIRWCSYAYRALWTSRFDNDQNQVGPSAATVVHVWPTSMDASDQYAFHSKSATIGFLGKPGHSCRQLSTLDCLVTVIYRKRPNSQAWK